MHGVRAHTCRIVYKTTIQTTATQSSERRACVCVCARTRVARVHQTNESFVYRFYCLRSQSVFLFLFFSLFLRVLDTVHTTHSHNAFVVDTTCCKKMYYTFNIMRVNVMCVCFGRPTKLCVASYITIVFVTVSIEYVIIHANKILISFSRKRKLWIRNNEKNVRQHQQ